MGDDRSTFVVVSNRLPVDRVEDESGPTWKRSPGGLVTALDPVMREHGGAWIGWPGKPDMTIEPFDHDGVRIVPVALTADELEEYYEGFSNDTLWPLYHDVIAPPAYHRDWWDAYRRVNARFAQAAADEAAPGATVWVHDYQLQLVPQLLRELRPDLVIGYFHHIPFPGYGLFAQLPWRTQIIEGLLGADVIGFQRGHDAENFARSARRLLGLRVQGGVMHVPHDDGRSARPVLVRPFPISIDVGEFEQLARRKDVQERARQIRRDLGDPEIVMLGVDRLDYTKGIRHRLKAVGELFEDGRLHVGETVLVQVASPSRERVEAYIQLRDEIELIVGRINGDFGTVGHQAISYLHQGYGREEMAALYLAADVMLVTALRDGMNLVAKEYVAARIDEGGVLVLSEFTGAADELRQAVLVNPHDIDGLKDAIMHAIEMPRREVKKRMKLMRRRLHEYDVAHWSRTFLTALAEVRARAEAGDVEP